MNKLTLRHIGTTWWIKLPNSDELLKRRITNITSRTIEFIHGSLRSRYRLKDVDLVEQC